MLAATIAGLALSLSSCGDTKVEKAYKACDVSSYSIRLADDGGSILIDGAPSYALSDVACILNELDTPDFIVSEIDATTALMGRQHEEDGGISYEWSYHPDNGLDMVIREH